MNFYTDAAAVQALFVKNGWTLSLAESCTGGSLAAALTQIPGSSAYFLGSLVCYSNRLKEHLLHVPKRILQTQGAVSEDAAKGMASGVVKATGSDFGLAITGIAGPDGGTADKPVGTVWIATIGKGLPPQAVCLHLQGNRQQIIEQSVQAALGYLLNCNYPPF